VGIFPLVILLAADTIVQMGSLIASISEFLYQEGGPTFNRQDKQVVVWTLAAIKLVFAGFMAPFSMVIYQDCCCPMSAIDGITIGATPPRRAGVPHVMHCCHVASLGINAYHPAAAGPIPPTLTETLSTMFEIIAFCLVIEYCWVLFGGFFLCVMYSLGGWELVEKLQLAGLCAVGIPLAVLVGTSVSMGLVCTFLYTPSCIPLLLMPW
jgi:hypothetical protein